MEVYCQLWEESERGWGVRPDGYSLHISQEYAQQYEKEYLERQHKLFTEDGGKGVPDEYSRPSCELFKTNVDEAIYNEVAEKKSIRKWDYFKGEIIKI